MTRKGVKTVPPDGGWGWFIVFGSSLINLSTRAIEPSFGLLFGDLLTDLGVATTGASIVISTLDAIINFSGLFVGPLIKRLTYRKVAIIGGILSSTALLLTAYAESMVHIITTFSVIGGIGFGLATASTLVGINSYFSKKKGQAVGLAMAGTALGFMAMPQIVSILLSEYDFRSTMLILGALSLHSVVGAFLFQPVKWHLRPVISDEEKIHEGDEEEVRTKLIPVGRKLSLNTQKPLESSGMWFLVTEAINTTTSVEIVKLESDTKKRRFYEAINIMRDPHSVNYKKDTEYINRLSRQFSGPSLATNIQLGMQHPAYASAPALVKRKNSTLSHVSLVDLTGSSLHIEFDKHIQEEDEDDVGLEIKVSEKVPEVIEKKLQKEDEKEAGCWDKFCKLFDLNLLKDGVYLNILYGLSVSMVAEMNFKLIIPFFLGNLGYTKREIAMLLSLMAVADITARVIIPPILDRLTYPKRITLMIGSVLVSLCRSLLAEQTKAVPLLTILVIHGFFRGMTLINNPLVLSEYASGDNFPAVLGLSMVAKGIFIVVLGPLCGYIRDKTQSFPIYIHFQSLMIFSMVIAWSIELIVMNRRAKVKTDVPSSKK